MEAQAERGCQLRRCRLAAAACIQACQAWHNLHACAPQCGGQAAANCRTAAVQSAWDALRQCGTPEEAVPAILQDLVCPAVVVGAWIAGFIDQA